MSKVSASAFASTCQQMINQYGDEVLKELETLVPDAAENTVKEIQQNSKKRTGKYAKNWAKKVLKTSRTGQTYVVYNRKEYRVAHLLENGHVVKNKYGTYGTTSGDGVIAAAEDATFEWIDSEIKRRLEGG